MKALPRAQSTPTSSPAVKALREAWLQKKAEIFAGKLTKPDSEDPDTVNHLNWYITTGFKRALSRREDGSPRRASSTTRHPPRLMTTTKTRSDCNGPLPDDRGEGFLFMPQTQSPRQPEPAPPPL